MNKYEGKRELNYSHSQQSKMIYKYIFIFFAMLMMFLGLSYKVNAAPIFPGKSSDQVVAQARSHLGSPYVFGGTTTSGWDCSGYVTYVASELGVNMGRNTNDINSYCDTYGNRVASGTDAASFNTAYANGTVKPGDIVVFFNSAGASVHTGIIGTDYSIFHAWGSGASAYWFHPAYSSWCEGSDTVHCRFDKMWEVNGGHGKDYSSYIIWRGVEDKVPSTVRKVWNDEANNDGFRPGSITARLYANGVATSTTVKLSASNNWTATVQNLNKYNGATLIKYTWREIAPSKYTPTYSDSNNTTVITNTHVPEKVESKVTKIWNDTNNNDGFRPASVQMQLYKNDKVFKTVTLNAANNWTHNETNLYKYSPIGKLNTYYWREVETFTNHDQYEILETVQSGYNTTITNWHDLIRVSSTVKKNWNDTDNNDGFRPASINVNFLVDGKVSKTVTLNEANNWQYTEYNLLKYKPTGKIINYSWEEVGVPAKYTLEGTNKVDNTTTITNKHPLEKVEVHVKKVWEDNDNHDKVRPTEITANLLADGEYVKSVKLNAANNWQATISNLNKYKKGKVINYTFEEMILHLDYDTTYETVGYDTTITNIRDLTRTSRTVIKEWNDKNDQDGIRPESILVNLLGDGKIVQSNIELSPVNNWRTTIARLPLLNEQGNEIVYEFQEVSIPEGYEVAYNTDGKITTITNTHNADKVTVDVKKVWDDEDDRDRIRPNSITMRLYADGVATDQTVRLSLSNEWYNSISNLEKYKDGKVIRYEFKEDVVPDGYTVTSSVDEYTTTITNTHEVERTLAHVEKVWDDEDNIYQVRPLELEVALLGNDKEVTRVTLNEANDWKATVSELPLNEDGKPIKYRFEEVEIPGGYMPTYEQKDNLTIINNKLDVDVHGPNDDITNVSIKKFWNDEDNIDNLRPDEIEVLLLANGRKIVRRIILNEENNWSATVEGLNTANGQIEYTWVENGLPLGYENDVVVRGNLAIMTNYHTPDKTSVTVQKLWNDDNDAQGLRPEEIKVDLLSNGEKIKTVTLNEDNNWIETVNNLPMTLNDEPVTYTWKEISEVKGYKTTYDTKGSMTYITNSLGDSKTSRSVEKIWKDENDKDNIRPQVITVNLFADDEQVKTVQLSKDNNWKATVANLPISKNGEKIIYTWDEVNVEGYETTYSTKDKITYITNTHKPEQPTTPGEVLITKTDIVTGAPLPNTGIRVKDSQGNIIVEGRTDESGIFKFSQLELGKYTYQEFDAPDGYLIDENEYPFEIKEYGEVVQCKLENKRNTGSFELTKTDFVDDKPLPNTGIRIKDEDGNVVIEGKTDENGKFVINDLKFGKYTYEEYEAPEGYVIDTTAYPFEIKESGEVVKANMKNKVITGSFELTKTDFVDDKPLPNTGIRIKDEDGKIVVEGKTDKDGKFIISDLKFGKYTYEEYEAPEGYLLDTNSYPFEIKENDEVVKANMKNKVITGSFELTKTDFVDDKPLPNTGIRIKDENGNVVIEGKTDKDGKFVIKELPYGKYTYEEYEAPEGYLLDTNPYPFEIKENGEVIKANMKNKIITNRFELTKTDYVNSEPLPNASIRITNTDTNKVIFEGKTDKDGKIILEELPYGHYTYQEYEAPEGYVIDTTPYPFEVKENGAIIKCELKNKRKETTPTEFKNLEEKPTKSDGIVEAIKTGEATPYVAFILLFLIGIVGFVIVYKKNKK